MVRHEPPDWFKFSPTHKPDVVAYSRAPNGSHLIFEVKTASTVKATITDSLVLCASQASFGATEKHWLDKVHGRKATDSLPSTPGDYPAAKKQDHLVFALIHCLWGGLASDANWWLDDLGRRKAERLGLFECLSANWTASSFTSYYGQLFSIASAKGVAEEFFRWLDSSSQNDADHLDIPKSRLHESCAFFA